MKSGWGRGSPILPVCHRVCLSGSGFVHSARENKGECVPCKGLLRGKLHFEESEGRIKSADPYSIEPCNSPELASFLSVTLGIWPYHETNKMGFSEAITSQSAEVLSTRIPVLDWPGSLPVFASCCSCVHFEVDSKVCREPHGAAETLWVLNHCELERRRTN